jgi:hypothetical protein
MAFMAILPPVIFNFLSFLPPNFSRCNVEWVRRFLTLTSPMISHGPPPNSSLRQGIMSKFSNLAFGHLISLMGLFFKIGVLPFFEKHLLIME